MKASRAGRLSRSRSGPDRGQDGFTIVEVLFALGILVIAILGSSGFFFSALKSTAGQRQRQTALTIAQKQMEHVRSVPAANLLDGRLKTDVSSLETAMGSSVLSSWNVGLFPGWGYSANPADTSSLNAAVPLCTDGTSESPVSGTGCPAGGSTPAVLLGTTYTVRTAIDTCIRETSSNVCDAPTSVVNRLTAQMAALGAGAIPGPTVGDNALFRVTVDVSWPKRAGLTCATNAQGDCHVLAVSLIDRTGNPVFVPPYPLTVTGTTPTSISTSSTTALTLTGTYFETGATVSASSACSVSGVVTVTSPWTTSSTITGLTVTGGSSTGTCVLTVTNPDGLSAVAPPIAITAHAPTITSLNPSTLPVTSSSGFTITGTYFVTGATVTTSSACSLAGTPVVTGSGTSSTTITGLTITAGVSAGICTITVTNPDGQSASAPFTVTGTLVSPLLSWGTSQHGEAGTQLLNGTTSTAVQIPGLERWSAVSAGYEHTCGITTSQALYCWGHNGFGQVGDGTQTDRYYPAQNSLGGTWSSVAAGYYSTCGIQTSGKLYCWGHNGNGEVGDNTTNDRSSPTAVSVSGVTTWLSVSVGQTFACGIKTDNTLWCWGNGGNGRLGTGGGSDLHVPTQVGSSTWTSVGTGYQHACAIKQSDSSLWCWGYNGSGQIGNNNTTNQNSPVAVSGGGTWQAVDGAQNHTCGIQTSGKLYCWGNNANGDLGNNSTNQSNVPVQESTAATNWSSVATLGQNATCATTTGKALYCWGYNGDGQVGDSTTNERHTPTRAGTSTSWTQISGGEQTLCGVMSSTGIWCQGDDSHGQMEMDLNNHNTTSPTVVLPSSPASATPWLSGSGGTYDGCGVRGDGTLWCWGHNPHGELGQGNGNEYDFPVQVGSATTWASVDVGYQTVCAINTSGALYCWGYGGNGQLGTASTSDVNVVTAGPSGTWSSVSVGYDHTCAIKTDNTLWCWGQSNHGQLGQGNGNTSNTPVNITVTGVTGWSSVSAGVYQTCAITGTGLLYCWGDNSSGQDGVGVSSGTYQSPQKVGSATWISIAAGQGSACGVQTAGTLWCWGSNGQGQLGTGSVGSPGQVNSPTQVGTATSWSQAGAGNTFACGLRTDHTVWCWGYDNYTSLGDRSTTNQGSPQQIPLLKANWINIQGQTYTVVAGSSQVLG